MKFVLQYYLYFILILEENCQKLEEKMAAAGYPAARRLQVGPTIGAHVGPGAYAVLFVEK